jgi:eukaryotic-like serine/threonine-protein kinase
MIDQVISHYRIIRKLGAGGMGEVYLASDLTLGRHVALKLLPHEHTQDEERLRRFKQEARSASALNHPNILTIHDVGEADGHHFIATEFIDGESLRATLDRDGSMSTASAVGVASRGRDRSSRHQAGEHHAPARRLRESPRFRPREADRRRRAT